MVRRFWPVLLLGACTTVADPAPAESTTDAAPSYGGAAADAGPGAAPGGGARGDVTAHPGGGATAPAPDALGGDDQHGTPPPDTGATGPLGDALGRGGDGGTDAGAGGDSGPAPDGAPDLSPDAGAPHLSVLVQGPPVHLDANPTVNYRGVDAAWDAAAGAFLFVYGNAPIGGAWVGLDGSQIGAGFLVSDAPFDGSNWTQNPRISPSDGGSLVSWHMELPGGPVVQVRRVRRDGPGPSFDGPAVTISGQGSSQESPAALGYAPSLGEHLVVWAASGLHGRRLAPSGAPLTDVVPLSEPGVWVEFPSVAWSPAGACWFVVFMQETAEGGHVVLERVDAAGQPLPPTDLTGPVAFAKVTDVAVEEASGQIIATWFEVRDGVTRFAAQRFSPSGVAVSDVKTVFAPFGSYDGYDLAPNAVTGTSLAVFHGPDIDAFMAELAPDLSDGPPAPLDSGGATKGAFLPRAVAAPGVPAWLVAFSPDYAGVIVVRVTAQ